MKKSILSIAVLLMAATLLVCCGGRRTDGNFKTMMLKSEGEVETLPDMATFTIDLNCLNARVAESKKCLVEKSKTLTDRLLAFGIEQNDIKTTSIRSYKSYTWRNNSQIFEGYRSSLTTYVTVKNLNKLDEIYNEFLEDKNLEISGLNYTHSKIDSLGNEAYLNALNKSNALADKLLTGLTETQKEVIKIGNVQISTTTSNTNMGDNDIQYEKTLASYEALPHAKPSLSVNKGMVKVNAILYVEYRIK